MTWRCYYETATGRLVSAGSIFPPDVPSGLSFIELADQPDDTALMWDNVTHAFIARPAKVRIDRLLGDVLGTSTDTDYANLRAIYNARPAAQRTQILNALAKLLGNQRFRNVTEPVEIP